jgi:hypothetical protein
MRQTHRQYSATYLSHRKAWIRLDFVPGAFMSCTGVFSLFQCHFFFSELLESQRTSLLTLSHFAVSLFYRCFSRLEGMKCIARDDGLDKFLGKIGKRSIFEVQITDVKSFFDCCSELLATSIVSDKRLFIF